MVNMMFAFGDWKNIWQLQVPERIRLFIWLVAQEGLKTKHLPARRYFGDRFCLDFPGINEPDWLDLNFYRHISYNKSGQWKEIWATTFHYLWHWRNQQMFVEDYVMPQNSTKVIKDKVQSYCRRIVMNKKIAVTNQEEMTVHWKPTNGSWITLNTNGAVNKLLFLIIAASFSALELNYNNKDKAHGNWHKEDDYGLQRSLNFDISQELWNQVPRNEDLPIVLDDETTPVKACGDFAYSINNGELNDIQKEEVESLETCSQAKRRRMLQFNNQNGNHSLADVQMSSAYLELNGTGNSNADIFPKVSQWISDVSDSASAPNYEDLQSAERWLADCFKDTDMQMYPVNPNFSVANNVHADVTRLSNLTPPPVEQNVGQRQTGLPAYLMTLHQTQPKPCENQTKSHDSQYPKPKIKMRFNSSH
ncbi:uncharacterized protein LOC127129660 [Lathyrus oleraceus]|uniref:uncharacterized protein LOC127129660 n=1 Tax=Pisum sativum TaxID=3888 RepID=UPI0021CFB8E5|nr:uncharacterized protein LOC127129660 [Pisum sativum]